MAHYYALYWETEPVSEGTLFHQSLFIPYIPLGSSRSAPGFATRKISPGERKPPWKLINNTAFRGELTPELAPFEIIVEELDQLSSISSYLLPTLGSPSQRVLGSVAVPVPESAILELLDRPQKLPASLSESVEAARRLTSWSRSY